MTKTKIFTSILLLLFAVIPGSHATLFNGLPLSNWETLIVCLSLAVIWLFPFSQERFKRVNFLIIFLIVLNLIGFKLIPYGWSTCVKSDIDKAKNICESSAEFRKGTTTALFPSINFGQNKLPLFFMNERTFNFYSEGEPDRKHLPYTLDVQAYLFPGNENKLKVDSSIKDVKIILNDKVISGSEIFLNSNKWNHVQVQYSTERNDSDYLRIKTNTPAFYNISKTGELPWALAIYRIIFYGLISFLFGLLLLTVFEGLFSIPKTPFWILIILFFISSVTQLLPSIIPMFSKFLVSLAEKFSPFPWKEEYLSLILNYSYLFFFALLILLSLGVLLSFSRKTKLISAFIVLFIIFHSFLFVSVISPYGTLKLLSGGDDPLTHESAARYILTASSFNEVLIADEPNVFYYQPLYRYFLAIFHKFFGESMWGPYFVQTLIVTFSFYFFLKSFLNKNLLGFWSFVILLIPFTALGLTSIYTVAQDTLQQSFGMPLFLLILSIAFWILSENKKIQKYWYFVIGLFFGLDIMIRTDLIPAILGFMVIAFFLIKREGKNKAFISISMVLAFLVPLIIVVIRNYLVGGKGLLFPTSNEVNLLPNFKDIFPATGPSESTGLEIYWGITKHYSNELSELIKILGLNILNNFIGLNPYRLVIWFGGPVLAAMAAIFTKGSERKILLSLIMMIFAIVLSNSFYGVHNGFAMLAYIDILLVFVFSLSLNRIFLKIRENFYAK